MSENEDVRSSAPVTTTPEGTHPTLVAPEPLPQKVRLAIATAQEVRKEFGPISADHVLTEVMRVWLSEVGQAFYRT